MRLLAPRPVAALLGTSLLWACAPADPTAQSPVVADSTCRIEGLRFTKGQTTVSPTMTVRHDTGCSGHVTVNNSAVLALVVSSPPQHGRLTVDPVGSTRPRFRYLPARGYTGPDSFSMVLQPGNLTRFDTAVDVTP